MLPVLNMLISAELVCFLRFRPCVKESAIMFQVNQVYQNNKILNQHTTLRFSVTNLKSVYKSRICISFQKVGR